MSEFTTTDLNKADKTHTLMKFKKCFISCSSQFLLHLTINSPRRRLLIDSPENFQNQRWTILETENRHRGHSTNVFWLVYEMYSDVIVWEIWVFWEVFSCKRRMMGLQNKNIHVFNLPWNRKLQYYSETPLYSLCDMRIVAVNA